MNLRLLLEKTTEIFPLFTMGKGFKGAHSVYLNDGKVVINVWWKGKSWMVVLTAEEESMMTFHGAEAMNDILNGVKAEIENDLKAS